MDETENPTAEASAPASPAAAPSGSDAAPKPTPNPSGAARRARWRGPLMLGGIAVVVLGAGYFWLSSGRYVSTDDAYVRAAKLMVSTDVSGLVSDVDVKEGEEVKAGEVLFRIDPRAFKIALADAEANLAQTTLTLKSMKQDYQRMLSDIAAQEAVVANDEATFERYQVLVKSSSISQASFDQARFALTGDKNKLASLKHVADEELDRLGGDPNFVIEKHPQYLKAKAAVDEAQRQLDHATVRAPFDGIATAVDSLQPGLFLVAQTASLTNQGAVGIVSTDNVWIDANLKETDLTHVKAGDKVSITVDAYPSRTWQGAVASVSPASGSEFSILPAQNASGNWVKVVQRIPVRIRVDRHAGDPPLRAGMSAVVDIDTRAKTQLDHLAALIWPGPEKANAKPLAAGGASAPLTETALGDRAAPSGATRQPAN